MKQRRYANRLQNGQPVCSSVFTWMSGVVVDEPSTGLYRVKVDADIDHHSEHVYISEDEIITIRDEAIESAEYELDFIKSKVKRAVTMLNHARGGLREAKEDQREAEARLRAAKDLPLDIDANN